jgi:hypothetical protein
VRAEAGAAPEAAADPQALEAGAVPEVQVAEAVPEAAADPQALEVGVVPVALEAGVVPVALEAAADPQGQVVEGAPEAGEGRHEGEEFDLPPLGV